MRIIDKTDMRFGRLRVLRRDLEANDKRPVWVCECDCGTIKSIRSNDLGAVVSCGCYLRELRRNNIKHGMTRKGEKKPTSYYAWSGMKDRCTNSNSSDWKYYGGRGISFCPEWMHYENFLQDMGEPPAGMTLDRVNNDKGYSKENCRWATRKQQANNRRIRKTAVIVMHEGRKVELKELERLTGLKNKKLRLMVKSGMTYEQIVNP